MKSQKCVDLNHLVVFTECTGPMIRIKRGAKQYIYNICMKVQARLLYIRGDDIRHVEDEQFMQAIQFKSNTRITKEWVSQELEL